MKRLTIFRPGRHIDARGSTLDFSEDQVRESAEAYDPQLHEAPIVVGHPKDDSPAYGWVQSLSLDENNALVAEPHQVMPEFGEAVEQGRWKKRSAAFYHPDSPNNPKPGVFYLKHVGFLGAKPPAVKGMPDPAFSENHPRSEEGVIELVEAGPLARILRGLREYLISRDGVETADRVAPDFFIEDLENEARNPEPAPDSGFTEPGNTDPNRDEDPTMDAEKEKRLQELEAEQAKFSERETTVAEREKAIELREAEIAKAETTRRVDAAVSAGKVLPAERDMHVDFAMGLDASEATIEFGEGDNAEKVTRREQYLRMLDNRPKVVELGEHSAASGQGTQVSEGDLAAKARAYVEKQRQAGNAVSFTEAYDAVSQGKDVEVAAG